MHMADALLSPAVGGALWAAAAGTIAGCSAKLKSELDDRKVPLMGVLGAFVFAAQMINFAIPGTGSSGHLGGGLLLAVLLGPCAALLTTASVLTVQALFFADGGLLALGCNIFNLGFLPAFVAYPLIYRPLAGSTPGSRRHLFACLAAAVAALQLGALGVVLQTHFSGVSELPLLPFLAMMLPIHLAIGLVEGLVTAAVLSFIARLQPDLLSSTGRRMPVGARGLVCLLLAALMVGGGLSHFAANDPDGLEWAISRVAGTSGLHSPEGGVHALATGVQEETSLLPDYGFTDDDLRGGEGGAWGTTVAGLVGGAVTLLLTAGAGVVLRRRPGSS